MKLKSQPFQSRRKRALRIGWSALAISATLTGLVAGPAQAGTLTATGDRCGPATLIYVRGTSEPAGSGSRFGGRIYQSGGIGNMLVNFGLAVDNDQQIPVYQEALNYPATALNPATLNYYTSSVSTGVVRLRAEIEDIAATCPYTNILLAGYSQGAHVIGDVIDKTNGTQLSANAKAHITAVALWADPTYKQQEAWDAAGNGLYDGYFIRSSGAFSPYTATIWPVNATSPQTVSTVRSYCKSGDEWCQSAFPDGGSIHASYNTTSGWAFMRQFLISQD